MQLLSQLQQAFSTELTIAQLFNALTPALQAQMVLEAQESSSTSPQQDVIQPVSRETQTPIVDDLTDTDVDDLLAQLLKHHEVSQ